MGLNNRFLDSKYTDIIIYVKPILVLVKYN